MIVPYLLSYFNIHLISHNLIRFTRISHVFSYLNPFRALMRGIFFLVQNIIHKKTLIHRLLDSPFHRFFPRRSFCRAFCETKYLDALVRAAITHKRGWTRERTGSIAGAWPQGSTQSCIARHRKVFLLAYEIHRLRADITHLLSFVRA